MTELNALGNGQASILNFAGPAVRNESGYANGYEYPTRSSCGYSSADLYQYWQIASGYQIFEHVVTSQSSTFEGALCQS